MVVVKVVRNTRETQLANFKAHREGFTSGRGKPKVRKSNVRAALDSELGVLWLRRIHQRQLRGNASLLPGRLDLYLLSG